MDIHVNDIIIPRSRVLAEMQYHPGASREQAEEQAATALLIRELLRQEAGIAALMFHSMRNRRPAKLT